MDSHDFVHSQDTVDLTDINSSLIIVRGRQYNRTHYGLVSV